MLTYIYVHTIYMCISLHIGLTRIIANKPRVERVNPRINYLSPDDMIAIDP